MLLFRSIVRNYQRLRKTFENIQRSTELQARQFGYQPNHSSVKKSQFSQETNFFFETSKCYLNKKENLRANIRFGIQSRYLDVADESKPKGTCSDYQVRN